MKSKTQIVVNAVEGWFVTEELPHRGGLRVLRPNHPDHGLSEDEVEARNEFIAWHLRQELGALLLIPAIESAGDFFLADLDVTDSEYSAFNTHDFHQMRGTINWWAYAERKLEDRVNDLALLCSCLSHEEGRRNTKARYTRLLQHEFQDKLDRLAQQLHVARDPEAKAEAGRKIGRIQQQVWKLNQIWTKCSAP